MTSIFGHPGHAHLRNYINFEVNQILLMHQNLTEKLYKNLRQGNSDLELLQSLHSLELFILITLQSKSSHRDSKNFN